MILHAGSLDPTVPVDIADALELWARDRGQHLRMEWTRPLGCFSLEFTHPNGATEMVPLHEWDGEQGAYVALRLDDYGVSGLIEMLERLDTRSGRGLYDGMQASIAATRKHNEQVKEAARKAADEVAREVADRGRSAMKIPYFRVGIDLNTRDEG